MSSLNLSALDGLSENERAYALKILQDLAATGFSADFNNLKYADYEEVPVDIETFLHDPKYLGKGLTNEEGRFTVYPYWVNLLKEIFPDPIASAKYNTLALSGAIGLGKSFVAVIIGLYELYRMLCLKDPYLHFGLQPIDKITFAFMNITIDAAKGVAWDKCQQLLQSSDWFMSHGTVSKSLNPEWSPPKGIELIYGSQSRHIIGRAVYWCLDGDTKIAISTGDFKLKELVGKEIRVLNVDDSGNICLSDVCTVLPTAISDTEYHIELEDGTILRCTSEHRFMLRDGSYKEAQQLDQKDTLFVARYKHSSIEYSCIQPSSITKITLTTPKQFYDVVNANPYNNFLIKTTSGYVASHNCFFDEVSFQPNSDVNKQKEKAKTLVNTAAARMQSRFMHGEDNPTLLVLASSKRTESSFMETFIEGKRKTDSKTTRVVDEPQWVIRTDKDSPNKFKVAIGNKFLTSEVLPLNVSAAEVKLMRDRGYRILDVPMGYYESFIDDIEIALTDIAGISTTNSNKYISGARIAQVKTDKFKNLFTKDVIEVGNGPDDFIQYKDFIDLSRLDSIAKSKPLYIHMDMSVTGDKTGIAGVWIDGKKQQKPGESASKELYFRLAFSVSVKAPKGYQISFEKNRQFIYWLKEQGFNVKGISTDTFQSVDTGQTLAAKGFNYSVQSMDRVGSDRICKPYQYLRSTIYEQRIAIYEDSILLTDELIGLQRDNNSGKIDHDPSGINSKDQADAVCGAVWLASLNAEQYEFDFGETLEVTTSTNLEHTQDESIKQLSIDFETELNRLLDPIQATHKQYTPASISHNSPITSIPLMTEGILLW